MYWTTESHIPEYTKYPVTRVRIHYAHLLTIPGCITISENT